MGKLVRLWRGEWLNEGDDAWNFNADPTDFGFGAMIRHNETYESLLNVVRMRYVPKLKAQLLKGRKDDGAPIARLFVLRREAKEFCNDDMQTGKLVRLWRGEWLNEGDDAWNFNADPTDFGFRAMIRHNETYESLLNVVRMRYVVGQGTPVLLSY
ncbi:hypothetical protein F2Q69_00052685 [Brassica cretica]|uniref:Uncharacterized protein n=1 Tax=Brassica cretica TaxID=69181 RepID=A0A8S9MWK9_BRACR|nr:hypothetical protein F2Q69_00052685 [Brassica cretica]